jgi:ABC-type amino acid transport substrate-binding protein
MRVQRAKEQGLAVARRLVLLGLSAALLAACGEDESTRTFGSIEDMKGARVGVVLGETYENFLRENHPEIERRTYHGTPDIFQDMTYGRIQGFVTDRLVGLYQIQRAGRPFVPVGPLLYEETICVPVRPDDRALLAHIDHVLDAMHRDGTIEEITKRWFGREPTPVDYEYQEPPTLPDLPGDGPLRSALTGRFPPFSFYDQDGELIGFDVDVAREIGKRLGREVEFTTIKWDGILPGLLAGHYDTIISSMARTPGREEKVDFSIPYYRSGAQLFVLEKNAEPLPAGEQ